MRIRLDEIKCSINHTSDDFYGEIQNALLKTPEGTKTWSEKFGRPINQQNKMPATDNNNTMTDNNFGKDFEIDKKNRICDNNENSKNQSELSNINSNSIMINSTNVHILKKSLDARKKPQLFYIFSVEVFWDEPLEIDLHNSLFRLNTFPGNAGASENCDFQKNTNGSENCDFPKKTNDSNELHGVVQTKDMKIPQTRPIVVGSGPAGLFAALTLAVNGLKPILIERGKDVDARIHDINEFWDKGVLLPESNVQFGEGGAGTFSDGKLTTGIKDPACRIVLETFVDAGAPIEIMAMSKPHIGTDLLRDIVKRIRSQIELLGGTVLFETKLTGIHVVAGRINAVDIVSNTKPELLKDISDEKDIVLSDKKDIVLSDKKDMVLSDKKDMVLSDKKDMVLSGKNEFLRIKEDESLSDNEAAISNDAPKSTEFSIKTNSLIIAIGHSARDTIRMLYDSGLEMHAKPFSMGVRIEHFQKAINESQYGKQKEEIERLLPAAEYKLSCHLPNGRGVYTFCMCPGGQVIASASGEGQVVTNGMSLYSRAQVNANSALLVNVDPSDFGGDLPLSGIDLQEKWERKAFIAGGSCYKAPAQYVGDFIKSNIKPGAICKNDIKTHTGSNLNPNFRANSNINDNPKSTSRINNSNAQKNNINSNKNNNNNNSNGNGNNRNNSNSNGNGNNSNNSNNGNSNSNSNNNLEIPMVIPSYTPGVTWTNLAHCLPDFVTESILSALPLFERKLAGFASPGAVMTGIESRSSSPVRISRNDDKMANIVGIFPCGEGAGYAGGIMSAAVDGIACAKACIEMAK